MDRFITIWHKEAFQQPSDRTKYESRLRKALADSPAIRELSANPLLLTMMAVLNRVQDLPRDRGRLYERCAELLLKNWDLEKFEELKERKEAQDIKDKLGPEQKMRILELVAAAMQQERTGLAGNIIGEDKLKEIVEKQLIELGVPQPWSVAKNLIWMLRERNFMLAYLGDRQYAFVHRTFLEYFCARDLKYRLEKTTALSVDQLATLFAVKWPHDEWQEVLCLLTGMIGVEHAAKCISALLTQNGVPDGHKAVFLAAKCLLEIRELGSIREVRAQVQKALFALVKFVLPNADQSYQQLSEIQRIRAQAVLELARGWKEEIWVLTWLKERALQDENYEVRSAAVEELARGWQNEPWMAPWLKERALNDENPTVRSTAVQELLDGFKSQPWMMAWLQERAQTDEDEEVRGLIVEGLATGWKEEAPMLTWLKERAVQDQHDFVRWVTLTLLSRGWKDDPPTLSFLKDRAQSDESSVVRQLAIRDLATIWKDEAEMASWLKQRARQDNSESVRRVAIAVLAADWKDDPGTLPFLKDLAGSGGNRATRKAAMDELADGWPNNPEVAAMLQQRPARSHKRIRSIKKRT